jgi:ribosome-associated translation inhibitor RaiA
LVEREETNRARDRINQGKQSKLDQIRRRHQMEIEAADNLTQKKLSHLQNERDAVVARLERQLQKAKEREKNEPDVIRAKYTRGQWNEDVDLPSPRTARRIYHMRTAVGAQRLNVGGVTGDERVDRKRRRARSLQKYTPG